MEGFDHHLGAFVDSKCGRPEAALDAEAGDGLQEDGAGTIAGVVVAPCRPSSPWMLRPPNGLRSGAWIATCAA